MKTLMLKDNIFYTGVVDHDLRTFDIIMTTEFGTSYNSYVVKGSEKTALIETAKANFFDEYISGVSQLTPISEVDYLIVNHTEPDHSGSVRRLLELNPDITVVGTAGALGFLAQIVNREFKSLAVKENDTLSLGDKTLSFMPLPNLHWPDTMFTYIPQDKVLFTCDFLGAHFAHDGILRSNIANEADYYKAAKYYFDCILAPFKQPFVTNALARIAPLDIEIIATGHGPVLDSHIDELIELYKTWSKKETNPYKSVVIPYVSAYGYTKMLAEKIAAGIETAGDIKALLFDMEKADADTVLSEVAKANGLLLGSPTILSDALEPIWNLTSSMHAATHGGKPASAFGAYGWSGEAVPNLIARLGQLRFKTTDGLKVRFMPTDSDLEAAFEFGRQFGKTVLA